MSYEHCWVAHYVQPLLQGMDRPHGLRSNLDCASTNRDPTVLRVNTRSYLWRVSSIRTTASQDTPAPPAGWESAYKLISWPANESSLSLWFHNKHTQGTYTRHSTNYFHQLMPDSRSAARWETVTDVKCFGGERKLISALTNRQSRCDECCSISMAGPSRLQRTRKKRYENYLHIFRKCIFWGSPWIFLESENSKEESEGVACLVRQ